MPILEPTSHHRGVAAPERERVCLHPGATLNARALRDLEQEARELIAGGLRQLTIDLRDVRTVDWTTAATLAAISRFAGRNDARLSVIPGRSPAMQRLLRAGLMNDLTLENRARRPFFDWSR